MVVLLPYKALHYTSSTHDMYFSYSFAEPTPPTDVTTTITGTDSAVVSWTASQSKCGAIANYSVTYQLTSGMSCSATVYTTGTSLTLRGLIPNAEYSVEVSATNSRGGTSALSGETPFTVSTPTGLCTGIIHYTVYVNTPYNVLHYVFPL